MALPNINLKIFSILIFILLVTKGYSQDDLDYTAEICSITQTCNQCNHSFIRKSCNLVSIKSGYKGNIQGEIMSANLIWSLAESAQAQKSCNNRNFYNCNYQIANKVCNTDNFQKSMSKEREENTMKAKKEEMQKDAIEIFNENLADENFLYADTVLSFSINNSLFNENNGITRLYKEWWTKFENVLYAEIDKENVKRVLELISIYDEKKNKFNPGKSLDYELSVIKNAKDKISILQKLEKIKYKIFLIEELKLTGTWEIKGKSIDIHGELISVEEIWTLNTDNTFTYEYKKKYFLNPNYIENYKKEGFYNFQNIGEENPGLELISINDVNKNKQYEYILIQFEDLSENKMIRNCKVEKVNYPVKLKGKKNL